MIIIMIIYCLIIYAICWALHAFSNYLDFDAPAKAEKKYKETIEKKYHIKGAESNRLIDLKTNSAEELHRKAIAHARYVLNNIRAKGISPYQQKRLFNYYYYNYIEKHKLSHT